MNFTDLVKQIQPVFIVAPSARNGITLVQRMLNSTRQIVIYGENSQFMDQLPAMVHSSAQTHNAHGQQIDALRQKFFTQTTEYWSSSLWPSTEQNMLIMFATFNNLVAMYQQCTQEHGYARWGVKNPMVCPQMIDRLYALIPNARFIFLYRNLYEVLRSARARKFIDTPASRDQFIQAWRANAEAVLAKTMPHVLKVKYEDLVAQPEGCISTIERFTGVSGIDPKVLDRKINTFIGPEDAGMSPTGYIEPGHLTDEDLQATKHLAGDLLDQLGYREG